jgi:hypothetical protein
MKMNPLHLEQLLAGEKTVSDFPEEISDAVAKEIVRGQLDELKRSNREILDRYPADDILAALQKKTGYTAEKAAEPGVARQILPFFSGRRVIMLAAAACFVLAIPIITFSVQEHAVSITQSGAVTETTDQPAENRIKGNGSHLYVYKKNGDQAVRLDNNAVVHEGDTLQISYIASGAKYGAILSIDGNGTITQHYPYNEDECAKLENAGEIALEYAYQLDNAPSFERFILLTSDQPFTTDKIVNELNRYTISGTAKTVDLSRIKVGTVRITDLVLLK